MENQNDDVLLKYRNSRACISAGYRLFTGNFKKIFRHCWAPALVLALAGSLVSTYFVTHYPQLVVSQITAQATGQVPAQSVQMLIVMAAGTVLLMLLFPLFLAFGVSQLRQHQASGSIPFPTRLVSIDRHMMWRTLKCHLAIALTGAAAIGLIAVLGSLAMTYLGLIAAMLTYTVLILAFVLLILPLYESAMRYLMTGESLRTAFARGYRTGMSHYAYVFVIALVDLITTCVAGTVTTLPSVILSTASLQAQTGVLNGDPLGMPPYITPLTLVVFLLAQFVRAFVLLSALYPLYYMHGSLEVQEEEKKKAKQQM